MCAKARLTNVYLQLSRLPKQRSGEGEGTSSTRPTEQSEVEYRERYSVTQHKGFFSNTGSNTTANMSTFSCILVLCRKAESCDMQDLVQMMTQTLRMDIEDSVNEAEKGIFGLTGLPEFKLNRKYRDTLALHGKSREETENLSLGQIPLGEIFLIIFIDISLLI